MAPQLLELCYFVYFIAAVADCDFHSIQLKEYYIALRYKDYGSAVTFVSTYLAFIVSSEQSKLSAFTVKKCPTQRVSIFQVLEYSF